MRPMNTDRLLLISAGRRHAATGTGRTIRQAAGLSLSDIGIAVGANESTVWRWEEGECLPRGDRAVKYAQVLADIERATRAAA